MQAPTTSAIHPLSDQILDILLRHREEDPEFTFGLRSVNDSEGLERGLWFEGDENQISIALSDKENSANAGFSLGLKVLATTDGEIEHINLEITRGKEMDSTLVEFFEVLPKLVPGLIQQQGGWTREFKVGDIRSSKGSFLEMGWDEVKRAIQEFGLERQLLIPEETFLRNLEVVINARENRPPEQEVTPLPDYNHWLAGSYWGGKEQMGRFIENKIWENGKQATYGKLVREVNRGDLILLKSSFAQKGNAILRIRAIGKVIENLGNGVDLKVFWIKPVHPIDISGLGHFRKTFQKPSEEKLRQILEQLDPEIIEKLNEDYEDFISREEEEEKNRTLTQTLHYAKPNYDSTTGKDELNITNDVNVFGSILALKELKPPFAVALFGNWGSGKSFFMNKLKNKIGQLSSENKKDERGQHLYCRNIAQIDFNAWSYLDANLWAGLMASIFQRLDEYINDVTLDDKVKEELRRELNEELEINILQRESVGQDVLKLQGQLEELKNKDLDAEKKLLEKKIDELQSTNRKALVNEALSTVDLEDLKLKLEENGVPPEKLAELNPANASETIKATRQMVSHLFSFKAKDWLLLILLIAIVFGAPLLIQKFIDADWAGGVISFLSIGLAIVGKVRNVFQRISPVLQSWAQKRQEIEEKLAQIEQDHQNELMKLQAEQNRLELQISKTKFHESELTRNIERLESELQDPLTKKAFYNFIGKRSRSSDYEDQLGIISIIRKDLETLSALFTDMEIESSIPEPERSILTRKKERLTPIRKKLKDKALDRIILYIDDLDRCPDEKVLDVLQAVHLLMAFPLFVVVVGVDSRCVTNALYYRNTVKYSQALGLEHPDQLDELGIHVIQPSEYLEKIFQIPFQLNVPTERSIQSMMGGLIQDVEVTERIRVPELALNTTASNGTETLGEEQQQAPEAGEVTETPTAEVAREIPTEALKITSVELEDMQALNWMIGTNPRAVKRFANMYRIVRAHAGVTMLERQLEEDRLIMIFMLAFFIGPHRHLVGRFEELIVTGPQAKLKEVFDQSEDKDADLYDGFRKISERLKGLRYQRYLLDLPARRFTTHLNFIKRFSFPLEDV